jgi:hypothetical protein
LVPIDGTITEDELNGIDPNIAKYIKFYNKLDSQENRSENVENIYNTIGDKLSNKLKEAQNIIIKRELETISAIRNESDMNSYISARFIPGTIVPDNIPEKFKDVGFARSRSLKTYRRGKPEESDVSNDIAELNQYNISRNNDFRVDKKPNIIENRDWGRLKYILLNAAAYNRELGDMVDEIMTREELKAESAEEEKDLKSLSSLVDDRRKFDESVNDIHENKIKEIQRLYGVDPNKLKEIFRKRAMDEGIELYGELFENIKKRIPESKPSPKEEIKPSPSPSPSPEPKEEIKPLDQPERIIQADPPSDLPSEEKEEIKPLLSTEPEPSPSPEPKPEPKFKTIKEVITGVSQDDDQELKKDAYDVLRKAAIKRFKTEKNPKRKVWWYYGNAIIRTDAKGERTKPDTIPVGFGKTMTDAYKKITSTFIPKGEKLSSLEEYRFGDRTIGLLISKFGEENQGVKIIYGFGKQAAISNLIRSPLVMNALSKVYPDRGKIIKLLVADKIINPKKRLNAIIKVEPTMKQFYVSLRNINNIRFQQEFIDAAKRDIERFGHADRILRAIDNMRNIDLNISDKTRNRIINFNIEAKRTRAKTTRRPIKQTTIQDLDKTDDSLIPGTKIKEI